MTPADLAKFNPGKVLLTIECEFQAVAPDGKVGFATSGGRHVIDGAAIVSIERVRPALPVSWEWKTYPSLDCPDRAVYTDGRGVEVVQVWVEDGESEISVAVTDLAQAGVPFAVIEAVRNA